MILFTCPLTMKFLQIKALYFPQESHWNEDIWINMLIFREVSVLNASYSLSVGIGSFCP